MTVRELIDRLSDYDEDTLVYLNNDNGYTYGSITDSSFEENFDDEEEEE